MSLTVNNHVLPGQRIGRDRTTKTLGGENRGRKVNPRNTRFSVVLPDIPEVRQIPDTNKVYSHIKKENPRIRFIKNNCLPGINFRR